jgi:hypothetical protein
MVRIKNDVFLIEKKHSTRKKIPAVGDIKDGFLRLIIYNNIITLLNSKGERLRSHASLGLTSDLGTGACSNTVDKKAFNCRLNLNRKELDTLQKVFNEGATNGIVVFYLGKDSQNQQETMLEKTLSSLS